MKSGEKSLIWCSAAAVIFLVGFGWRIRLNREAEAAKEAAEIAEVRNYRFPIAELVALDRDTQARFAVIPENEFGVSRMGYLHGLYRPETEPEKKTVAALKRQGYEVAFFVMSRRTYENERGPIGFMPIQGPVHITSPRSGPQPRWSTYDGLRKEEHDGQEIKVPKEPPPLMGPSGTPEPTTAAEGRVPANNGLYDLGLRLFRISEKVPPDAFMGGGANLSDGWKVAATTIRANDPACVKCHMGRWGQESRSREEYKLGDAFGVAMYVYRKLPEQTKP